MEWYVKKGALVSEEKVISIHFCEYFVGGDFPSTNELITSNDLQYNTADIAPTSNRLGIMFPVCTLITDLSSVPRELFKLNTNSRGTKFWELNYNLNMSIESATVKFFLTITDKECGLVIAKFEG